MSSWSKESVRRRGRRRYRRPVFSNNVVTDVYDVAVQSSSQNASTIFCELITRPGGPEARARRTFSPRVDYFQGVPLRARAALDQDHGSRYIFMPVKTEQRRQQILNLLQETGTLNVSQLADRFAVSVVTIRKDLDNLENEDLLQRTFGGAVFSHRSRFNRSFLERAQEHRREKCAIAAAAYNYIKDGDTIMLDAGTTALALAEYLKTHIKSAFIITCSVPAALELSSAGYDILLLGGTVRNKSLALLGRETLTIIERYRADKVFLGSTGFTAEMGHTTPNPDDAQIKEALMRAANETYVLVDSSKYGHRCLTSFARLRDVDLTITDNKLSRSKAKLLEAAGGTIQIVDPNKLEDSDDSNQASGNSTAPRNSVRPLRQDR